MIQIAVQKWSVAGPCGAADAGRSARRIFCPSGSSTTRLLSPLSSSDVAGLIEDADAPDHLLEPLELTGEHAERAGRAGLRAANDVAFEEQLAGLLRLRGAGEAEHRQCDGRSGQKLHGMPSRATMLFLVLRLSYIVRSGFLKRP